MNGRILLIYITGVICLAAVLSGCQSTTSSNAIITNQNNAAIAGNANSSPPPASTQENIIGQSIETSEPARYSATLELSAETRGGEKNTKVPALTANIARDGEKRRAAFNLPNNEQVIYLNAGDNARYLVLPGRRQYAELSKSAVGFGLPRLMMPDQIIEYLKDRRDYQKLGEEDFKGRRVVKYRSAGAVQTGTPAGEVSAESFTYVDKQTGLPLRAEFASQTTGSVQGVRELNAVVEMRDVKTDPEPSLFEVPQGYDKIAEEQVREQVKVVTQAAAAIAGAFLN